MATATHIPGELLYNQGALSSTLGANFDDTGAGHFTCLIVVAGSGIPSTLYGGVTTIANVTATNAEISYSGYARQALTGITWAALAGNASIGWSFANITFPQEAADPGTGRYGVIAYLGPAGSYTDANAPVVGVLDFGQLVSTVNGPLVLQCPTGGLILYTGAG